MGCFHTESCCLLQDALCLLDDEGKVLIALHGFLAVPFKEAQRSSGHW